MQRPERLFLVENAQPTGDREFSRFVVAWKDGAELYWLQAGRGGGVGPISPAMSHMRETDDASPPTEESIARDLGATLNFAPPAHVLRAWDVSRIVGRHHPRIRRGEMIDGRVELQTSLSVSACGLGAALMSSTVAAKLLFDELEDVCGVIEPEGPAQLAVYGHRLRHLLISACTEVESAWRSILIANSPPQDDTPILNTRDYVQLADPMRLREWRVRFTRASAPLIVAPFEPWDAAASTESLAWYSAYNATKHAREAHLDQAQLGYVIQALAAVHVMLSAQFGTYEVKEKLRSHLFEIEQTPSWEPVEHYVPSPFDDTPWRSELLFPTGPAAPRRATPPAQAPGSTTAPPRARIR